MNTNKLSHFFLLLIITISGCGSGLTSPDTNGGTRILGINFGIKVPALIAFSRLHETNAGPTHDLYVMFPDGTHVSRLTSNPGDDDFPAFSPDGLSLAFISNNLKSGWGNRDIFRLYSPSKVKPLTDHRWEFDSMSVDWGPDFLVTSQLNTLIGAPFDFIAVRKMDPLGKIEEAVDTGFIASYDPCVSRDGKNIAFCARLNCPSEDDPGCNGTLQLFILRDGETVPEQLTFFGGTPQDPILTRHPAFDFTGERIVFQTTFFGDDWEIAYLYIDSGPDYEIIRVTDNDSDDIHPCFSPDGSWIAFVSNRDGNFEIYKSFDIFSASPGQEEQTIRLTNTPEDESHPDWSRTY